MEVIFMLEIRKENINDYKEVYKVIKSAFEVAKHSERNEQDLVESLRNSDYFIIALSLVAVDDKKL